ncbi:MAG: phenylalanine 4-monooxygenase [Candidatus Marinimicrobia bacterium]|nr:phenylalanine 4-monooxygenase [Candidatus Neomarinimicrobiota bacterium]
MKLDNIPKYLKKYIFDQNYDQYSAIDHACWRFIMRINKSYFSKNAHYKYLEGLDKTGITIDKIPKIDDMNKKMNKFGWQVVGVRGFIPPLIFMDFQSRGILPIACDMRSLEHLTYTPAPDIVHEAAGHSPMIADADYAEYLKYYGKIACKAISSSEDYDLYIAIRELSDIKENPQSSDRDIKKSEKKLEKAVESVSYISEAAYLSRIHWWTVEYGLVGDIDSPKIYGAGLLSSIGESENCLKEKVKKIPISHDCINYSYDITEQQPQLFVTKNFRSLFPILDEISNKMAYKTGGILGIDKAVQSKTICSLELDSNLQISGVVSDYIRLGDSIAYIRTTGPTQIAYKDKQIENHGVDRHMEGFGSPIGYIENGVKINDLNIKEFNKMGYGKNQNIKLQFSSGVKVKGIIKSFREHNGKIQIITFENCTVSFNNQILFEPEWGEYDMVCGTELISVYGGVADIEKYYEYQDINDDISLNKNIIASNNDEKLNKIYSRIREIREQEIDINDLKILHKELNEGYPHDWLANLEIYELVKNQNLAWVKKLREKIETKTLDSSDLSTAIQKALLLI